MDVAGLRKSFADVAARGDDVALYCYSDFFTRHPEVRDMFPIPIQAQRRHLVDALVKIISSVDNAGYRMTFLQGLARDHLKFGTVPEHNEAIRASLLATLECNSGPSWTPELKSNWAAAYDRIGSVMIAAARADEGRPPWWRGTVTSHERRSYDISVLQVRPEPAMDFIPGQSVAIECPSRPRLWRYYSMANAPREDGLLEFHIRLIDGDGVSMALTSLTAAGTELRLGPPLGVFTLQEPVPARGLLLVAGSTGLAPLKAMLNQLMARPQPPEVHLFFGARKPDGLYDLDNLLRMAAEHPWLTVTSSVSVDPQFASENGSLPDVVARHGDWSGRDAYLAGPSEMVQDASARLVAAGMAKDKIHFEDFGWSEPLTGC